MKDIEAIRTELVRQLDWRGPSGKEQGHIVLGRMQAEVLVQWIDMEMALLKDREIEFDAREITLPANQVEQLAMETIPEIGRDLDRQGQQRNVVDDGA